MQKNNGVKSDEKMDSALTCVAYKSVIDVSKLKFDDFRNVYSKVVDKGIPDDVSQEERKKIIMQCIQDAKDIFEMLGGKLENDPQSNLLKSSPEPQFELGGYYLNQIML